MKRDIRFTGDPMEVRIIEPGPHFGIHGQIVDEKTGARWPYVVELTAGTHRVIQQCFDAEGLEVLGISRRASA